MSAVGLKNNPETFENAVASLVDMASILFAYQIGVYGFGMGVGVLYACFDAFIVIWMRKPISRFARSITPLRLVSRASAVGGQREGAGPEQKEQAAAPTVAGPEVPSSA